MATTMEKTVFTPAQREALYIFADIRTDEERGRDGRAAKKGT